MLRTPSLPWGSGHPRSEAVGKQEEHLALCAAKIVTHVASEALALSVRECHSPALPPQRPLLPLTGPSSTLARVADDEIQIQRLGALLAPSLSLTSHLGHGFASQLPARGQGGDLLPPAFRISLALSSSHLPLTEQTWPLAPPASEMRIKASPLILSSRSHCNTTSTSGCGFPGGGSR